MKRKVRREVGVKGGTYHDIGAGFGLEGFLGYAVLVLIRNLQHARRVAVSRCLTYDCNCS